MMGQVPLGAKIPPGSEGNLLVSPSIKGHYDLERVKAKMTETQDHMTDQPTFQDDAPIDYFGFFETHRFDFPDGKQWIEFQSLNEGAKKKFQASTSRDLVLDRRSGDARMKVDPATERHELIKASVVGWSMFRGGEPVPFTGPNLGDFLTLANPSVIDELEKAIRKANPWLMAEMSVADIDKEIENLQEMRKIADERERGEAS